MAEVKPVNGARNTAETKYKCKKLCRRPLDQLQGTWSNQR